MGIVYRAYDTELGAEVALKTLRNLAPDEILRMKREFRSLANLSHPNLVVLHELFCEEGFWFFTMELVRGVNFSSYVTEGFRLDQADTQLPGSTAHAHSQIKRWPSAGAGDVGTRDSGVTAKSVYRRGLTTERQFTEAPREQTTAEPPDEPAPPTSEAAMRVDEAAPSRTGAGFSEERLRAALRQLVLGVRALHAEGKRHRDLKPDNVMVTTEGRVVILDFGLVSSRLPDESNPDEDATAGTPAYMAPEQMWGAAPTEASDWYSVGVMLFEALTGRWPRMPSVGASLEPLAAGLGVPADLAQLCTALLSADPSKRPSGDEILARISHAPVSSSTPAPSLGMFFGRKRQLEALYAAFGALRQGQSVVVQVRGSSGFGKTTLVRQFLRSVVESHGALVIEGRCYERETVPHKVFDSLLDSLRGHLLRLPRAEALQLLPRDIGLLARVFPVLRSVDTIGEEPRPDTEVQDPQELIRRASLALKELLGNLTQSQSVVLFVDDLQWGDVDSARLLREVLAAPVIRGLMVLVSYRLEETNNPTLKALLQIIDSTNEGQVHFAVDVGPLERAAAREMIRSLVQGSPAVAQLSEQHRVDSMIDESEGNPFLLHEFAQHLSSGQDATGVALEDVVRRRVALLPTSARVLLETVAVAGQPISQALALGAAGLSPDSDALQVLRTSHLVRTGGARRADSVECYHDRIREAVAELPEARLRACHRRLAEAIERSLDADVEALATHWERAGEPRRAVHHARVAATKAAEALAFDHAANLYVRVLGQTAADDAERPQLLAALGDTLRNANRGREAADAYLEAAVAVDGQLALELRRRACEQLLISGHVEQGLRVADELMIALGWSRPKTPRAIVASMLVQRAKLALRGTRFRERAESELDAALLTRVDLCWSLSTGMAIVDSKLGADFNARYVLMALRSGEPRRISRALALEAAQSSSTGAMDRAERFLGIADELAQRTSDPHCIGLVRLMRGFARYFAGRWREALGEFDAGLEIFRNECTGVTWETTTSQAFAMWSLLYLGDWTELVRRGPALLAEAQQRNNLYWAHSLSMSYGIVSRLMNDDPEGARAIHQSAARRWPSRGFQIQTFLETYMGGWIDLYAGSAERSVAHIDGIWPEARGSLLLSVHDVRLRMLHIRAYTALADPSPRGKSERYVRARKDARIIEGLPSKGAAGVAKVVEAGVLLQLGKVNDAKRCLEQALATFLAAEMSMYAAGANRRLGELIGGDAGAARVNESDRVMRANGVKQPERMARVLAPIYVAGPSLPPGAAGARRLDVEQ